MINNPNNKSNQNQNKEYDTLSEWFTFCFDQHIKNIYTSIPANVQSYNKDTRRAIVQIAIKTLLTTGDTLSQPLIADVPVIFPASSQFIIHFPLVQGDAVMLLFSQRGLSKFKSDFKENAPDEYSLLSMHDAVAIAGFGAIEMTATEDDTLSIQDSEANNKITLDINGNINIMSQTSVSITSPTINLNGDVKINGDDWLSHSHSDVAVGSANTGTGTPI